MGQLLQVLGDRAELEVQVYGSAPLHFQWQKDSLDIPGATNSILTLFSVETNDAGAYRVQIANRLGSVLSATAGSIWAVRITTLSVS